MSEQRPSLRRKSRVNRLYDRGNAICPPHRLPGGISANGWNGASHHGLHIALKATCRPFLSMSTAFEAEARFAFAKDQ
jgi:hypothetical protein